MRHFIDISKSYNFLNPILCVILYLSLLILIYPRDLFVTYLCRKGVVACKLPRLEVSNPEIIKFIHDVPPLSCGPEDWVTVVEGSKLVITSKAKMKHGQIICIFSGTSSDKLIIIYLLW